jgi:hypothetical protein
VHKMKQHSPGLSHLYSFDCGGSDCYVGLGGYGLNIVDWGHCSNWIYLYSFMRPSYEMKVEACLDLYLQQTMDFTSFYPSQTHHNPT